MADRAQTEWELPFECIGDPHQEIPETARDRGWLEIFVQTRLDFLKQTGADFEPTHPKGYFQPGVLVLSREGRVLYRWRSVPNRKNVGGALVRPTARHVWSSVQAALSRSSSPSTSASASASTSTAETGARSNSDAADVAYDAHPEMDSPRIPWALFASLLIANGWFLRPRAFARLKNGPTPEESMRNALLRLVVFIGLWVAAFAVLPTLPVAVCLAGWVAWIVPKVQWLGLEFQNVGEA